MIKKIKDIYGNSVYIGTNIDYKRLQKEMKAKYRVILDDDDMPEAQEGREVDGMALQLTNGYLIWVRRNNVGVIAHECMHGTQYALEWANIKLSKETKEVYAYYLGWLVNNAVNGR